jgi:putative nucleotidyltransferase with HDIG domain
VNRQTALEWLKENVSSESLLKHCYAVEAAMRAYGRFYDEDVERWGMCGLLHDIDFERYPDEHPLVGVEWLKEKGFDEEFVVAVKAHGDHTHTPRETHLAKALYAVDELASFIIAVALVRPDKLQGMTPKSVKKKLKDKAFARAVDREGIQKGAEAMGVDLTDHIARLIETLQVREEELSEQGVSLL